MMQCLVAILVVVALSQAIAEKMRFDYHTMYRVVPKSKDVLKVLQDIKGKEYINGYHFLGDHLHENIAVDIVVPPEQAEEFKVILVHPDVDSKLLAANIQDLIDKEGFRAESRANSFNWTDYHTLEEINAWLRDFAYTYPDYVTLIVGGKSYEGREILGVKVSYSPNNTNNSVFVEANIHAREWISSAVATYLINQLIVSQDPTVRDLANSYDWYIFPVTNPDGFAYSHTTNRLWRGTRTPHGDGCFGADANRNWPYQWMHGGSDDDPCSDSYAGPSPLSEPSTNSLSKFIDSIGTQLEAYISFHSYSQLLLLSYAHTTEHLDNYDELMTIGRKAVTDLASRYGTKYDVGSFSEALYIASGVSMDWVKHEYKVPITYTFELRDTGEHGFWLPADQIIPTTLETIDSLVSIFKSYRELHPRNATILYN